MKAIHNNGYTDSTIQPTFYTSNLVLVANENGHLVVGKQKEKELLLLKQIEKKKRQRNLGKDDPEKQSRKTLESVVDTIEEEERKCSYQCLDPVQTYIAKQIALLEQCEVVELLEQEKIFFEQQERMKRKIRRSLKTNDVLDEEKNVRDECSKLFLKKFAFDEEIRQCRWSNEEDEEEGNEDEKTITFLDEEEDEQTLEYEDSDINVEVLYKFSL